jgi:tetratricopeptide (TPR) repeat protein
MTGMHLAQNCVLRIALRAFLIAPALLGAGEAAAQEQHCIPPQEMKLKLAATPTVEALNDLGVWFGQHDQFSCAVQAFATSLETDPQQHDLPHVAFELGAALFYSGDMTGAIAALQQAENFGYRDVTIHELLATALESQHSFDAAAEELRKALEFDPDATAVLDALSTDLIAAGRYQEAVDLLDQPRVGPQRSAIQFVNSGVALEQLGRAEEAAGALYDGLNTWPASNEIARQLAKVLTGLGRTDEAAMVLRVAASQQGSSSESAGLKN